MANQHVVQRNNAWAVRGEGNQKDTSLHNTQQEAFEQARGVDIGDGSLGVVRSFTRRMIYSEDLLF